MKRFLVILSFIPLLSPAQTDTAKGKFRYVVCDETKSDAKPGHLLSDPNERTIEIDTSIDDVNGTVVNSRGDSIPFACVIFSGPFGVDSSHTDLHGNYELKNLVMGRYKIKVVRFGYNTFSFDSLVLHGGETREVNIDLGDYNCARTKVIYTNTPLKEGEYQPQQTAVKEKN